MRHSAFAAWAAYARTERLDTNGVNLQKFAELRFAPIMIEDRTRYFKSDSMRRRKFSGNGYALIGHL